jgi:hypothetical protein
MVSKHRAEQAAAADAAAAAAETGPAASEAPLPVPRLLTAEELGRVRTEDVKMRITVLESSLKELKPDLRAIEGFKVKQREYAARIGVRRVLLVCVVCARLIVGVGRSWMRSPSDVMAYGKSTTDFASSGAWHGAECCGVVLIEWTGCRLDEFMAGFTMITMKLKEMYQMITLGGDAELELVDSLVRCFFSGVGGGVVDVGCRIRLRRAWCFPFGRPRRAGRTSPTCLVARRYVTCCPLIIPPLTVLRR